MVKTGLDEKLLGVATELVDVSAGGKISVVLEVDPSFIELEELGLGGNPHAGGCDKPEVVCELRVLSDTYPPLLDQGPDVDLNCVLEKRNGNAVTDRVAKFMLAASLLVQFF
ncbi:MAG: hypothetical protein ACREXG_07090 [Polaromonas sp.]